MSKKISAGLLMYRFNPGTERLEVLLGHPGGPFYANKDTGYWGIPKGQLKPKETIFEAAVREFTEETGFAPAAQEWVPLGMTVEKNGKVVHAWSFAGNWDTSLPVNSNLFWLEWPLNSGNFTCFPELDRLEFFPIHLAKEKIEPSQIIFIRRLEQYLALYSIFFGCCRDAVQGELTG